MIKAIETRYENYRFRSRLEARWAVFFDVLGVPFEYEKEGFDLGSAGWYLPDFWLPKQKCWIEVKGEWSDDDANKCRDLAIGQSFPVFMFFNDFAPPSWTFEEVVDGQYVRQPFAGPGWTARGWCAEMEAANDLEPDGCIWWEECPECGAVSVGLCGGLLKCGHHECRGCDHGPRLMAAYAAARAARFEHGEQG